MSCATRRTHHFLSLKNNNSGVALIEFALILPILILILFGVIEFGAFFIKSEINQRVISTIASALKLDPTGTDVQGIITNANNVLVNYAAPNNFVCTKSWDTAAHAAALCGPLDNTTTRPPTVAAGAPYFIAISSHLIKNPFTPLFDFLPDINASQIIQVGGAVATNLAGCNGAGKIVQADANGNLICADLSSVSPCGSAQRMVTDLNGKVSCVNQGGIIYTTIDDVNNGGGQGACTFPNDGGDKLTQWYTTCGSRACKAKGYNGGTVAEYNMGDPKCGPANGSRDKYLTCPVVLQCF